MDLHNKGLSRVGMKNRTRLRPGEPGTAAGKSGD